MTTSTRVYGTSNRKCASMTSSALFTSVAESTVIFLPMVHVGCLRASATVARETRSGPHVRNGPPDAVRMRRASSVGCRPPDLLLFGEQIASGVRRQRDDPKPLPLPGQDLESRSPDRPGRAQDRDADAHIIPNMRYNPAAVGITKYSESSRSSTPP